MKVPWTSKAHSDVTRLHEFLAPVNTRAAVRVVRALIAAPAKLVKHPRMGERLEEFDLREVRRILVGDYAMRYEIQSPSIYILRIWHTRERR